MQLDVQELNKACGMTAPLNENSQCSGNAGTQQSSNFVKPQNKPTV